MFNVLKKYVFQTNIPFRKISRIHHVSQLANKMYENMENEKGGNFMGKILFADLNEWVKP